jgi:hypothetical protein
VTFTNEGRIVFDFEYETPLQRLIMLRIFCSGSGDGGREKRFEDQEFRRFCCCTFDEFEQAIAKLIQMGVIHKISYGYQYGKPSSGYIIKDPDEIIQL